MSLTYTPPPGFSGDVDLDYRVTNPDGGTSVGTVTVTVLDGNVAVVDDVVVVDVAAPITVQLGSNDVGLGQGSVWVLLGVLPDGLVLSVNGVLSGQVDAEFSGTVPVQITSSVDSQVFTKNLVLTVQELSWSGTAVRTPAFPDDVGGTDAERIARAQSGIRDWETVYSVSAAEMGVARDGSA